MPSAQSVRFSTEAPTLGYRISFRQGWGGENWAGIIIRLGKGNSIKLFMAPKATYLHQHGSPSSVNNLMPKVSLAHLQGSHTALRLGPRSGCGAKGHPAHCRL